MLLSALLSLKREALQCYREFLFQATQTRNQTTCSGSNK